MGFSLSLQLYVLYDVNSTEESPFPPFLLMAIKKSPHGTAFKRTPDSNNKVPLHPNTELRNTNPGAPTKLPKLPIQQQMPKAKARLS